MEIEKMKNTKLKRQINWREIAIQAGTQLGHGVLIALGGAIVNHSFRSFVSALRQSHEFALKRSHQEAGSKAKSQARQRRLKGARCLQLFANRHQRRL